jgi:hypothetical protein
MLDVASFNAQQSRRAIAPGRVDITLVVDVSVARLQDVIAHASCLAWQAFGRRRDDHPVRHDGPARSLPIDRPCWAVVVRPALPRVVIHVTDNTEAQLRILVENLSRGDVITQVSGHKCPVAADLAEQLSYPFAAFSSGSAARILWHLAANRLNAYGMKDPDE